MSIVTNLSIGVAVRSHDVTLEGILTIPDKTRGIVLFAHAAHLACDWFRGHLGSE